MREQFYKTIFLICCCYIYGTSSQEDSCVDMQSKELLKSTSQSITGEIQALVPGMRMNCSGKITSWKIAVPQQNFEISGAPIKLQVWRYVSDGVYRLIGSNLILHNQTEVPTVVVQNVSTNDQITFTTGDIIGFSINTTNYKLLVDSVSDNRSIIYTPSVPNKQLCTFDTKCDQIIEVRRNFIPQLQMHYELAADSADNNTSEICTEWSEVYTNCEVNTVESTNSDQRPTETSGATDRNGVTNTAEENTSKGSNNNMVVVIGTIIGGIIFVFLLIVIILTVIVCLRKRHFRKKSNHLINGPPVLELKSVFPDYCKPYQHQPPVTNCYSSEERVINHLVNGTKLNNEKDKNSFNEDDYVVMASYLATPSDTYEKMNKITPSVMEEKHKKTVNQDQPEIVPEKTKEAKNEIEFKTKENEKEQEAYESDEDKTMSDAITSWMDSMQILRISKQNVKLLTQVRTSINTVVYKGILDLGDNPKQEVAVRQLKRGIPKADTIRFMQEIAILTQIHHPSIIQFYGMIENENPRMAVVELGSHGNLEEFLKEQTEIARKSGTISDEMFELFKTFSKQIATGMNYAHNKEYAHGNLETKHIIITSQKQCKITGLSVICSACPRDMMSYLPSSSKMLLPPPEVAEDGRFMKESDVWSFGTILYLMWGTGHKPHRILESAYSEMLYSGNNANKTVIPEIPNGLPIINNMVKECWKLNPIKRPTFSSLVTWISELDSDYTDV